MTSRLSFTAVLVASMAIGASAASAHHPGIGGIGGAGGIFTIGAGTLDQGQFAFSLFVDYLRLKQLSDPTLLANIGNDVHGLQSVESRSLALAYGITNDLTVSVRLPFVRRTGILEGVQERGDYFTVASVEAFLRKKPCDRCKRQQHHCSERLLHVSSGITLGRAQRLNLCARARDQV